MRAAEGEVTASFDEVWAMAAEMGVAAIAVPEAEGGGGGTLLDQAVALEACAHEPGAGRAARRGRGEPAHRTPPAVRRPGAPRRRRLGRRHSGRASCCWARAPWPPSRGWT
ncbi:acyl-CoA dehydrogenase family protein [Nocardioides convexus]|uniref:acyl-CoA dehydrogenase family protein n=1 Tax=Nocardioides convexus TaxID=2712224 RepID=UPI002418AEAE|nr:acyl-CoA dehydrogenase family protein [Nocardioides convexus]